MKVEKDKFLFNKRPTNLSMYHAYSIRALKIKYMRGETRIYALTTIYKRSNKIMRAHNDLSAVKQNYARSQRYISGETKLCALTTIYQR